MASHWRRRKRLCMDFLISLEENTDGSVRAKKCLSGDGQIALDSDEIVASAAVQFAKDKRSRASSLGLNRSNRLRCKGRSALGSKPSKAQSVPETLADDTFVAVRLDSQNTVCRVYLDDEE